MMTSLLSVAAISTAPSSVSLASSSAALFPSSRSPHFPQLSLFRPRSIGIKCSYAGASIQENANSGTTDAMAHVKTERIVVLGGSGFVGSALCKAAVSKGIEVISLSREEEMQRINGDADIVAVAAAKDFGIPRFVLISLHDYNLPSFCFHLDTSLGREKQNLRFFQNIRTQVLC